MRLLAVLCACFFLLGCGDQPDEGSTGALDGFELGDLGLPDELGTSCVEAADCALTTCLLGGDGCESPCLLAATHTARVKYEALLECSKTRCVEDHCKDDLTAECLGTCNWTVCGGVLIDCLDDGDAGEESCADATPCFQTCGDTSTPYGCMSGCVGKLTPTGKDQLRANLSCAADAWLVGRSFETECVVESMSCWTGGNSGDAECYEVFDCFRGCSAEDVPCFQDCVSQLSGEAQKAYANAQPCFGVGPTSDGCSEKVMACMAPAGQSTCIESLGCMHSCYAKLGEDAGGKCWAECLHHATPEGATAAYATSVCNQAYLAYTDDPPADNWTELQVLCIDASIACAAPGGTRSCSEIYQCMVQCSVDSPTDGTCTMECLHDASAQGAEDYATAEECRYGCSPPCTALSPPTCWGYCMNVQCPEALAACQ